MPPVGGSRATGQAGQGRVRVDEPPLREDEDEDDPKPHPFVDVVAFRDDEELNPHESFFGADALSFLFVVLLDVPEALTGFPVFVICAGRTPDTVLPVFESRQSPNAASFFTSRAWVRSKVAPSRAHRLWYVTGIRW
jgi:hypothetical protein